MRRLALVSLLLLSHCSAREDPASGDGTAGASGGAAGASGGAAGASGGAAGTSDGTAGTFDGTAGTSGSTAGTSGAGAPGCAEASASIEARMSLTLDTVANDTAITTVPDFTVLLEANDGRGYSHSHGASSPSTRYESASTSKLVASVVILTLVDRGLLALDSKPSEWMSDFWTGESAVTLRDLLSFTSGLSTPACILGSPPCVTCVDQGGHDFAECVRKIHDANTASPPPAPGAEYVYSSNHLQIAGLMAMRATGSALWSDVFSSFQDQTGLFGTSAFDLPSATNPRLAGGMHWTAAEYLAFLSALAHNVRPSDGSPLLAASTRDALLADQRGNATVVESPLWDRLQEDWSSGLGNWLECPTANARESFDCGAGHRNSSPGAYGAYPFLDFDGGYVGIVARQSPDPGTFPEGIEIFREIEADARAWATLDCEG